MSDLEKYCKMAVEGGATHAKQIHPSSVVTAAWVRWKCQFGCNFGYNKAYCCPPDTPTPEQTRAVLDSYNRAILFHLEVPFNPDDLEPWNQYNDMLVNLESDIFFDGYYKALVLLAGPCFNCGECSRTKEAPCSFPLKARPSMEACGIDVFQTARNNGFVIKTLKELTETPNFFQLMLVD